MSKERKSLFFATVFGTKVAVECNLDEYFASPVFVGAKDGLLEFLARSFHFSGPLKLCNVVGGVVSLVLTSSMN